MNKYKLACADTEEDVEDCFSQMSASPVIQTGDFSYLYYFDNDVVDLPQYRNLISFLRTAGEEDSLEIIASSNGGNLFTATTLATEMENTLARVKVSARGQCASATTLIILAADEVDIDPLASIMFHSASGGGGGAKFHESAQWHDHWKELFPKMVDYYYKDILSAEEIAQLLEGKDFWMTGSQLLTRICDRGAKREEEFLAEQEYELTKEEFTSLFEKAKADKRKKIDRERKTTK